MYKEFYAHTRTDEEGKIIELQTLDDHLQNTAGRAGDFAAPFGMEAEAKAAGLLHDAGKVSPEFQNRILNNGAKCDHSTAGGIIANNMLKRPDIALCIMGHHGGVSNTKILIYCKRHKTA